MKLLIKVRDSEKLRLVYPGKKVSFTLICTLKVFPTSISRNTKQKRNLIKLFAFDNMLSCGKVSDVIKYLHLPVGEMLEVKAKVGV